MFEFKENNLCPFCKKEANKVSSTTVKAMIKNEDKKDIVNFDNFHFCDNPNCSVIYFKDKRVIKQNQLIKKVGIKEWIIPKTICYCFNITKDKLIENALLYGKGYVVENLKRKISKQKCDCKRKNPSGQCCLSDINKTIKKLNFVL